MNIKHLSLTATLFAAVLAPLSSAQATYVVDAAAGPGYDFTAIQPALDVAGPFDVIEVRAGSYPAFHATDAARIISVGHVVLDHTSTISGVDDGEWMILAGVHARSIEVDDCQGTVLMEDLFLRGQSGRLTITGCDDVRVRRIRASTAQSFPSVQASGSRLQLLDCAVGTVGPSPYGVEGRTAVELSDGSFLHAVTCQFQGQNGSDLDGQIGEVPPGGGDAIHTDDSSSTRLLNCFLGAGIGGANDTYPWVPTYGPNGWKLDAEGGHHSFWDTNSQHLSLHGGATLDDSTPQPGLFHGPAALMAGGTAFLTVTAQPLSSGRLLFGRRPALVEQPGTALERLVEVGRAASLGSMSATGIQSLSLPIPASWPRGTVVFLQTSATDLSGVTDLSNGIALIVR